MTKPAKIVLLFSCAIFLSNVLSAQILRTSSPNFPLEGCWKASSVAVTANEVEILYTEDDISRFLDDYELPVVLSQCITEDQVVLYRYSKADGSFDWSSQSYNYKGEGEVDGVTYKFISRENDYEQTFTYKLEGSDTLILAAVFSQTNGSKKSYNVQVTYKK